MRSRYSAFVRGDADYVRASWHPDTRPSELTLEAGEQWLALETIDAKQDGDSGQVHFRATHRFNGVEIYRLPGADAERLQIDLFNDGMRITHQQALSLQKKGPPWPLG